MLWRVVEGEVEVLLVHRSRYDDWSFPKGKQDPGETDEQTARREVLEETGFEVALGEQLEPIEYPDKHGRRKQVQYWAMTVTSGEFTENDEVDAARWLRLPAAKAALSYGRDRDVLRDFRRRLPSPHRAG